MIAFDNLKKIHKKPELEKKNIIAKQKAIKSSQVKVDFKDQIIMLL